MILKFHVAAPFCVTLMALCGCATQPPPDPQGAVTDELRDACPMLEDEIIDGFIMAVSGLRDNGLSEGDAHVEWSDGCNDIPPDGNFGGDVQACQVCLEAIVDAVYAQ